MKKTLKRAIGEPIIHLTERFPWSRRYLRPMALRVTEKVFGEREATIPMPYGPPLKLTNLSSNYLSFKLYWYGADYYEPISLLVFKELLGPKHTIFDIGANVGLYSLMAAHACPGLTVVAFEPNPKNAATARQNVDANGFQRIIKVEEIALSDQDGTAHLYLHNSDMSASLEADFQRHQNKRRDCVPVRTTKLDSYVTAMGGLGPSLLKVDVEGHEASFLNGARQTIQQFKPDMILEVLHPYSREHSLFLKGLGYRFYPITNRGFIEAEELERIPPDPFHFFNYLVSTRGSAQVSAIFDRIRERVKKLNLYQTCKYWGAPSLMDFPSSSVRPSAVPPANPTRSKLPVADRKSL